jgi:hypothetical protein
MTAQSAANLIEDLADRGTPRAIILRRFEGNPAFLMRARAILKGIYEMKNDEDVFWEYAFRQFHAGSKFDLKRVDPVDPARELKVNGGWPL